VGLLLEKTRVLKTHDQVKLFLLHTVDLLLVKLLLVSFALQLAFNLSAGLVLAIVEFILTIVSSFVALLVNTLLDLLGAELLLTRVFNPLVFVVHLVVVSGSRVSLDLGSVATHAGSNGLLFGLLDGLVALSLEGLLSETLLFAHLSLSIDIDVTATLVEDIVGALPSLINLADCLALFLLQEANAVAQQLQVLLGTLTSHLGSNQLLVKGRIVVLLIRSEVHLFVALSRLGFCANRATILVLFSVLQLCGRHILGIFVM